MYRCEGVHEYSACRDQDKGIRSLGAEIKGSCEPLNVGAGNQTLVVWKNNACS